MSCRALDDDAERARNSSASRRRRATDSSRSPRRRPPPARCDEQLTERFESAAHIVVCDPDGRLVGVARIEDVLAAAPTTALREVMDTDPARIVAGASGVDEEVAAWKAVQHGESALAVVDDSGRFVELVPPRRVVEVLLAEHDEDLARLGGYLASTSSARHATEESIGVRFGHRVPWLLVGLAGAIVAARIVEAFADRLEREVLIAFFVPGIVYMADAVGTQTEAVVIRGLSVGVPIARIVRRELVTGLLIGVALAGAFVPMGMALWGRADVTLTVAISLLAACSTAPPVAMALPLSFHRRGLPCVRVRAAGTVIPGPAVTGDLPGCSGAHRRVNRSTKVPGAVRDGIGDDLYPRRPARTCTAVGVITDRRAGGVLPVLVWLRSYDRAWLPRDVLAGLVLTTVLVPVGISYAEAAGLPAVTGLYATVVPLLVYAAVGPSRHLILGPDSSLVPLIAATVLPLAAAGSDRAGELAAMLAVLAGAMCAISSLARVGYLTDLLSIPIRYGYLNGIALLILVNQITAMCGLPGVTGGLVDGVRNLVDGVVDGGVDRTSLLLGLGAIAVILALRHWVPAVPAPLVVVIGGIVVVTAFDLASVAVVGDAAAGRAAPGRAECPR